MPQLFWKLTLSCLKCKVHEYEEDISLLHAMWGRGDCAGDTSMTVFPHQQRLPSKYAMWNLVAVILLSLIFKKGFQAQAEELLVKYVACEELRMKCAGNTVSSNDFHFNKKKWFIRRSRYREAQLVRLSQTSKNSPKFANLSKYLVICEVSSGWMHARARRANPPLWICRAITGREVRGGGEGTLSILPLYCTSIRARLSIVPPLYLYIVPLHNILFHRNSQALVEAVSAVFRVICTLLHCVVSVGVWS